MNIIELTIDQVVELWSPIRLGIIRAVSPIVTPDGQVLQMILCKLLKKQMQCWCIHNDEKKIYGYIVTSLETTMGKKILNIYSEYADKSLPDRVAYECVINALEQFAKVNGCHRLTGYSANPNTISLAEKMGFSSNCRVLIKEV